MIGRVEQQIARIAHGLVAKVNPELWFARLMLARFLAMRAWPASLQGLKADE
jgi:hypothetical protein